MWIHLWALLGEVHSIKPTFAMTGVAAHSRRSPSSGPLSRVLWKEYKTLKGCYVKWLKSPLFSITIGRRQHVHSPSQSDSACCFIWSESRTTSWCHISPEGILPMPQGSSASSSLLGSVLPRVEHSEAGCLLFSLINARLVSAPLWGQANFLFPHRQV